MQRADTLIPVNHRIGTPVHHKRLWTVSSKDASAVVANEGGLWSSGIKDLVEVLNVSPREIGSDSYGDLPAGLFGTLVCAYLGGD